ncbi:hypothetical protein [Aquibacillus salsiterrae]|uniref:Uncharacterized protein n=1 Tax=Aquibacillus salsiterrae TaxID=2950439 RepID=A0A9X3WKD3_9BACI|nr:hypothetical protein [Aquibacillus salsiterrae]MDC3418696.1 hypothetical protein [Aquibacillus salsiterrae]
MVSKLKSFVFESVPTGIRAHRKGDEKVKRNTTYTDDMDQAFPSGIYTTPNVKVPNLRFRDLDKWCQENGKSPESLTTKELEQFRSH